MDVRASDAERDATMNRLREAAAEGRLTLEELTDRIEAAGGAVMRSDLVPLTSDLPAAAAVDRASQAPTIRGVGDVKCSGAWAVAAESSFRSWFGNIQLDLRQARISAPETHIHARALFGNIDLLVPEGVEGPARLAVRSVYRAIAVTAAASAPLPQTSPTTTAHVSGPAANTS